MAAVFKIRFRRRKRPYYVDEQCASGSRDFAVNAVEFVLRIQESGNRHIRLVEQPRTGRPYLRQPALASLYLRLPRQQHDDGSAFLAHDNEVTQPVLKVARKLSEFVRLELQFAAIAERPELAQHHDKILFDPREQARPPCESAGNIVNARISDLHSR